ncbi:MAG: hypothetical protein R2849_09080 [Thermomicrobiales bacterium]
MTRSIGPAGRLVPLALGLLILAGSLLPSQVRADVASGESSVGQSNVAARADGEGTGFAKRPCIDKDATKDSHHDADSTTATAEATEKGARKHVKAGNHESAARAYEYAACLWDMISEFDNATAAYEKAAAEYDSAAKEHEANGDKVRAEKARENAERIRELLS